MTIEMQQLYQSNLYVGANSEKNNTPRPLSPMHPLERLSLAPLVKHCCYATAIPPRNNASDERTRCTSYMCMYVCTRRLVPPNFDSFLSTQAKRSCSCAPWGQAGAFGRRYPRTARGWGTMKQFASVESLDVIHRLPVRVVPALVNHSSRQMPRPCWLGKQMPIRPALRWSKVTMSSLRVRRLNASPISTWMPIPPFHMPPFCTVSYVHMGPGIRHTYMHASPSANVCRRSNPSHWFQ